MKYFQDKHRRSIDRLVGTVLPDVYQIDYEPAFPVSSDNPISLYQIIFAVGPGPDTKVRDLTLDLFQKLIEIMCNEKVYAFSDRVNLRARRHVPESKPEHLHMFIEACWNSIDLKGIKPYQWHDKVHRYINRFDKTDPLIKNYDIQQLPSTESRSSIRSG